MLFETVSHIGLLLTKSGKLAWFANPRDLPIVSSSLVLALLTNASMSGVLNVGSEY